MSIKSEFLLPPCLTSSVLLVPNDLYTFDRHFPEGHGAKSLGFCTGCFLVSVYTLEPKQNYNLWGLSISPPIGLSELFHLPLFILLSLCDYLCPHCRSSVELGDRELSCRKWSSPLKQQARNKSPVFNLLLRSRKSESTMRKHQLPCFTFPRGAVPGLRVKGSSTGLGSSHCFLTFVLWTLRWARSKWSGLGANWVIVDKNAFKIPSPFQ